MVKSKATGVSDTLQMVEKPVSTGNCAALCAIEESDVADRAKANKVDLIFIVFPMLLLRSSSLSWFKKLVIT